MTISVIKNILQQVFFGEDRTSVLKKNIVLSLIFRLLSVLISLLLIPVAIRFVDTTQFGIWLTLSSVIVWLSVLDIGLTNGLRNKLVSALSNGNHNLAKIYVSTVYFTLAAIFLAVWLIFIVVNPLIDWTKLFNISVEYSTSIKKITIIIFSYFCLFFLFKVINSVLLADQKAAYASLIDLLGQFFALITIYLMTKFFSGSLLYLCIGMCVVPVIVAFIFNLILFKTSYKRIAPSYKYFRKWCIKDLTGLSLKFFVIQIAQIVQYQSANLIIAHFFNMNEVTNYNIAFKYFGILSIFFSITLYPLWSASTAAYHNNEYAWIRGTMKKYMLLYILLIVIGIVMLAISNFVYEIWIGKGVLTISFSLSLWCFLYVIISMFGNVFVHILNGIGALKIQFLCSLFTPVLYVILCFIFVEYWYMGIYAVLIAAIISNVNGFVIAPIQFRKIFVENKKGIWAA